MPQIWQLKLQGGLMSQGLIDKLSSNKFIPIAIVILALVFGIFLSSMKNNLSYQTVQDELPQVAVSEIFMQDVSIPIFTQGVVQPKVTLQVASEVGGRILSVSPLLESGRFVKKGDLLLEIDKSQYSLEVSQAKAVLAKANLGLKQAKNRGAKALLQEARATYSAAKASLDLAQQRVKQTKIKAPFDGRIISVSVGTGQIAATGVPLFEIYAIDVAEIRLPLSDLQFELIDGAILHTAGDVNEDNYPEVVINILGKDTNTWTGKIVRAEGLVDASNRLNYVVAELKDPFISTPKNNGIALRAGQYIKATIAGKWLHDIMVLPRNILFEDSKVLVLDAESRIKIVDVVIKYKGKDKVYISSGLEQGSKVVMTPMNLIVDGMKVKVIAESELNPIATESSASMTSEDSKEAVNTTE